MFILCFHCRFHVLLHEKKITTAMLGTFIRNKVRNKVQVGDGQEMAQSERNSHSINRGVGKKTKMTLRYLYQENIS